MDFDKYERETTQSERDKEARKLGLIEYTRAAFQELYDDFLLYYQYENLLKDIEQDDIEALKQKLEKAHLSSIDIEQIVSDKVSLNNSRFQNYQRFMVHIDEHEKQKKSSSERGRKAANNNLIAACRREILDELVRRYEIGEIVLGSQTQGVSRMADIVAKEIAKKNKYLGKVHESELSRETLGKDFGKRIKANK